MSIILCGNLVINFSADESYFLAGLTCKTGNTTHVF